MPIRSLRWSLAAFVLSAGLCLAQDSAGEKPKEAGSRKEAKDPGRRRADRANGRRGQRNPEQSLKLLTEKLNLTDEQQPMVLELLKTHQAKLREVRAQYRQTKEEAEQMRAIRDAMREARETGDRAKMDEARQQVDELRKKRTEKMAPAQKASREAQQKLHDGIKELLDADQQKSFEAVWEQEFQQRVRQRVGIRSPASLRRMISRLEDLDDEQSKQIRQLFKDYSEAQRKPPEKVEGEDPRRTARKATKARQDKLYDSVMKILTAEQRGKIEAQIEAAKKKKGQRGGRSAKSPAKDAESGESASGG